MFRSPAIVLGILIALGMPLLAHAESVIEYDFRNNDERAQWNVQNSMTVLDVPDGGIELQSAGSGLYLRDDLEWPRNAGALTLSYNAKTPVVLYFLWADEDGNMFREGSSIRVSAGAGAQRILLSTMKNLPRHPQMIGFEISPNSRIEFTSLTVHSWNVFERLRSSVASFFIPDDIRPYSINFLWGPRFARNPHEADLLWNALPPNGYSAIYVLNVAIVLVMLIAVARMIAGQMLQPARTYGVGSMIVVAMLSAWILVDIHMSAAFIFGSIDDLQRHTFAADEEKTFRDRDRLYAFAEFVQPYTAIHNNYVLFAPREWPYVGVLRYHTFPVLPTGAEKDKLWVIYNRPDVTVSDGYVTVRDLRLSPKGVIIDRFDDSSFLFLVQP